MKTGLFSLLIVLSLHPGLFCQDSTLSYGWLKIEIDGFESDSGKAMIAIANSEENYQSQEEAFRGKISDIKNMKADWLLENLPFGEYAVKVFHDEDENGELDTNFLGIPKESYGFSNNPSARFGHPDWEDTKFNFSSDSLTVVIHVH